VAAALATGTHLETGFRIRLALHAADRLPVARAAKPKPRISPPMAVRWVSARAVRWPAPWPGQRHGLARTVDTALTTGPASLPATPARELETRG